MSETAKAVLEKKPQVRERRLPKRKWKILTLIAALVAIPIFVRNPYFLHVGIIIFLNIIYTCSYRFVLRLDQLHFGAHAYIAIGAYSSTLMAMKLGLPVWLSMPIAGLIAGFIAGLVGIPALRVKGVYFAIITWGFAEGVRFALIKIKMPFGGLAGIINIPRPKAPPLPWVGDIVFFDKTPYYFLALALMIFSLWLLYRMEQSKYGLTFGAIREADQAAQAIGINIMRQKVLAFAICSALAGIGGAFFAHYRVFLNPKDFTIMTTIYLALYTCVGGMQRFVGPIVGVVLLTIIEEFVVGFAQFRTMLFSGITIGVLLFLPEGVVSLPPKLVLFLKRRRQRKVGEAYGSA